MHARMLCPLLVVTGRAWLARPRICPLRQCWGRAQRAARLSGGRSPIFKGLFCGVWPTGAGMALRGKGRGGAGPRAALESTSSLCPAHFRESDRQRASGRGHERHGQRPCFSGRTACALRGSLLKDNRSSRWQCPCCIRRASTCASCGCAAGVRALARLFFLVFAGVVAPRMAAEVSSLDRRRFGCVPGATLGRGRRPLHTCALRLPVNACTPRALFRAGLRLGRGRRPPSTQMLSPGAADS